MTTVSETNSAKMERITAQILDRVRRNPGTSVNAIAHDTKLPYKVVSNICVSLINSKQLYREVSGNHHRYFIGSADRRELNKNDSEPITRGKPKKEKITKDDGKRVEFAPSPMSEIGKAINEIPADLKAYEPVETKPEETTTVVEEDVENIDVMLDQLKALKLMPRGCAPVDAQIDKMVKDIEGSLSKCVRPCPFCGGQASINTKGDIQSILCTCGATFAYAKNNKDLAETVKAWNMRA